MFYPFSPLRSTLPQLIKELPLKINLDTNIIDDFLFFFLVQISRKVELNDEEIETTVIYQIGAIASFAQAFNLEIEHVRLHGAMKEELNTNLEFAKKVALAIKKYNPWLNLYINNPEFKEILEKETGIKCALEVNFNDFGTIRQIRELEIKPDTIHFCDVESAIKAREVLKPTPVNYNRVGGQI